MAADFLAGQPIPELRDKGEAAMAASLASGKPRGFEVGYEAFAINGSMLGHGDPIKVTQGQRLLLHVLNASATESRSLALPGHTFTVLALDGNPVPKPVEVPVLWLGAAERISAIVNMTNPGTWVLGDLFDDDRGNGMGAVVEYAGSSGDPRWAPPPPFTWDYRLFTQPGATTAAPDHTIELPIEKRNAEHDGFNVWTLNGSPFDMRSGAPQFELNRALDIDCGYAMPATTSTQSTCTATPSKSRTSPEPQPPECTRTLPWSGAIKPSTSTSPRTKPAYPCCTATNNCTWTSGSWHC